MLVKGNQDVHDIVWNNILRMKKRGEKHGENWTLISGVLLLLYRPGPHSPLLILPVSKFQYHTRPVFRDFPQELFVLDQKKKLFSSMAFLSSG